MYAVGAEKDHIVPWDAAWRITQLFGRRMRFVLASSGHIAGIINPPGGKGIYWTAEDIPPSPQPVAAGQRRGTKAVGGPTGGLARKAVRSERQAAIAGRPPAQATAGCAWQLCFGEIAGQIGRVAAGEALGIPVARSDRAADPASMARKTT